MDARYFQTISGITLRLELSLECPHIGGVSTAFTMGRTYLFECPRCGYKAAVAGGPARGHDFHTQTIVCFDCHQLYDAVTRLRVAQTPAFGNTLGLRRVGGPRRRHSDTPPRFDAVLNQLPLRSAGRFRWIQYRLRCPVSELHRVEVWKGPGKCPRCRVFLDRSGLPFRTWD